jgi:hypothetical protein
MALEELRERLISEAKGQWEKFQETSLYIQITEKYENLNPAMQKLSIVAVVLFVLYLVMAVPLGSFSNSMDSVAHFEETRGLIRDMLKATRESQDSPDIATPPDNDFIQNRIQSELTSSRLLPEQIKGTTAVNEPSTLIPANLVGGMFRVSLAKLNLRQVVDIGYQLQSINPSVKLDDLVMTANAQDPRYFDVNYKLVVLNVPKTFESGPGDFEPAGPKKKSIRK